MNKQQAETLAYAQRDAQRAVRDAAQQAAKTATYLAENLNRLVVTLGQDNPRFNELGELQGNGVALDVALGRLYEKKKHLESIKYLIGRLDEQDEQS